MANMVLSELVIDCLLAGAPTNLYPVLVKATIDGVVLLPSEFGKTLAFLFSIIATQELVVPRSIPMIWVEVLRTEKRFLLIIRANILIMIILIKINKLKLHKDIIIILYNQRMFNQDKKEVHQA